MTLPSADKVCSDVSFTDKKGEIVRGTATCNEGSAGTETQTETSTGGPISTSPCGSSLADCTVDGQVDCRATGTFKAVNMINLVPGILKAGVTIAGVAGEYPSATYPLPGSDSTVDLIGGTFESQIKSNTAFAWFDRNGSSYAAAGDSDILSANGGTTATLVGHDVTNGTVLRINKGTVPNMDPNPDDRFYVRETSGDDFTERRRKAPGISHGDISRRCPAERGNTSSI